MTIHMIRLWEDVSKFIQSSDITIPLLVLSLLCAQHTYVKLIAMKMPMMFS